MTVRRARDWRPPATSYLEDIVLDSDTLRDVARLLAQRYRVPGAFS